MGDDLMAEEVEIDPLVRGSALLATQQFAVKRARFAKIVHGKGEVESGRVRHGTTVKIECEKSRLCG